MNPLVIRSIWVKKFLNLLESSTFYTLSESRLNCCATTFTESEAAAADDVYSGTKHSSTSVSSLYFLEKMENKTSCSKFIFGTKTSKFFFFFVTGVRVKLRFGRLQNTLWSSMFDNCVISAHNHNIPTHGAHGPFTLFCPKQWECSLSRYVCSIKSSLCFTFWNALCL